MTSIKLSDLSPDTPAVIIGIRGGFQLKQRLVGLGLNIGFEVEVMEPPHGQCGAMLVGVGGTRLMLGHGMADKILVRKK